MAGRTRSKTYDVLAVSSTVHKANADYLAGILRYASGRQDWNLWLFNPLADRSYGNVLPPHRASGVKTADGIPADLNGMAATRTQLDVCDAETIPLVALLYQGGYVTIKRVRPSGRLELGIPNEEISTSLAEGYVSTLLHNGISDWNESLA
ncbi:MAG: hypothetical protein IJR99_12270, partial [Kiritimatiellae bacterium]|nr:hypothetical protein [Kiritimatiellia bacterium]